jgi:tetratricopeptide (TPR) repeat protein
VNKVPESPRRAWIVAGVSALLIAFVLQLVFSARQNSITWDEDDHIYAGYMSWKHADFGLNPEHPPLVKLIATIPLLGMTLKMPALQQRNFKHEGFLGGKEFLFSNDADKILFRARMAAAMLTVLLVLLVFLATREMFGMGAALIALALLAFDPNLLAHGAVVGTDAGLSCFLFAAIYAFYRYVKSPTFWRLAVAGLTTGLALASKHTAILIFPMLLVLAITEWWGWAKDKGQDSEETKAKRAGRLAAAFVVISFISVTVLWATYGFRYAARPEPLMLNPPYPEILKGLSHPNDVRLLTTVGRLRLLPESYLYGLADVRFMSDFYTSYIFGKIYPKGVWFYFPAAMAIKSSLAFLILFLLAAWAIAKRELAVWREILFLTVPSVIYMLVAMGAGMNIGVRHVLPVYMFLTVLLAGAAWRLIQKNRRWAYVVAVLLFFQAISTARAFPAYLAYANELWGGPSQTYQYLTDSNVDWGQQLKATKGYLDQRGAKNCWFVYFAEGVVDYSYYGIPCKPLPTADSLWVNEPANAPPAIDGTVLISASNLSGYEFGPGALNPYEQFQSLRPTAVIQYGIFVFDGHFEIPLAASIGHSQKAAQFLAAKQLPEALAEAQRAVALAPGAVKPNALLGDIYAALGQTDEARKSYKKALNLAMTVAPEFQRGWVEGLEQKLRQG